MMRLLLWPLVFASVALAEPISFQVSETAGLRRFGYPVTASLACAEGTLTTIGLARLVDADGKEVPAQFTAMSKWPGGSVRGLDVDFTTSPGPMETQWFRVETGSGPAQPLRNGLSVTETPDEIIVASSALSHRIRRDGKPLLSSIAFGETEFIGTGGILTTLVTGPVEVVKRGPFNVTLNLGAVRLEYVSSKSWVKITQTAESPRELAVDAHFHLPELPLVWDFGLGSWLYGSLGKAGQTTSLRHRAEGWQIITSPDSTFAIAKDFDGCGHLANAERVAAFGVADASDDLTLEVNSEGRLRIAAQKRELTTWFHFVPQPIPVTAVTSPQAMISALRVTIKGDEPKSE